MSQSETREVVRSRLLRLVEEIEGELRKLHRVGVEIEKENEWSKIRVMAEYEWILNRGPKVKGGGG